MPYRNDEVKDLELAPQWKLAPTNEAPYQGLVLPGVLMLLASAPAWAADCNGAIGGARAYIANTLPGRLDLVNNTIKSHSPNAEVIVLDHEIAETSGRVGAVEEVFGRLGHADSRGISALYGRAHAGNGTRRTT